VDFSQPKANDMTSSHTNNVILDSPLIESITYNPGSFVITSGQPYDSGPTPKNLGGGRWEITVNCGRKKSSDVAGKLNALSGGEYHEYAPKGGGGSPDELNFMFGTTVTFKNAAPITLYLAQGSYSSTNNWWIGGSNVVNDGKPDLVLISNNQPIQLLRMSGSTFEFDFETLASSAKAKKEKMAPAR
jgi:hypothetical protein